MYATFEGTQSMIIARNVKDASDVEDLLTNTPLSFCVRGWKWTSKNRILVTFNYN